MLTSQSKIKTLNRITYLDLRWILFLGVLPIEKASLTLFTSESIGNFISYVLNFLVLFAAFVGYANSQRDKTRISLSQKYMFYFAILFFTYLFAMFVDKIYMVRFFSLICLLGYYVYIICCYKDVDSLIRDINKALLFVIVLSLLLFIAGNKNVLYIEDATSTVFKGITANRNSYSEISLFYIATSFYIWLNDKKHILWRLITSVMAVYTTILTNGAMSTICIILLFTFVVSCNLKKLRKLYSFRVFSIIYLIAFFVIVLSQNAELPIIKNIISILGKNFSLTGRTDIWRTAIDTALKSPLIGYGYDTLVLYEQGIRVNDPHNGLLYIALTQGVIGIAAFLFMLSNIVKADSNTNIKQDDAYISMLLFVIVWLIKGLVESAFSYPHFAFWCAIIIMELQYRKHKVSNDISKME